MIFAKLYRPESAYKARPRYHCLPLCRAIDLRFVV